MIGIDSYEWYICVAACFQFVNAFGTENFLHPSKQPVFLALLCVYILSISMRDIVSFPAAYLIFGKGSSATVCCDVMILLYRLLRIGL